jgi:hypothetical protein
MKRRTFNEALGALGPELLVGCSGEEVATSPNPGLAPDLYGSHPLTKLVLQEVLRDSVTVASKIWWRSDGGITPSLRFAFDNEFVGAISIGHMSEAQFDDTITNMQAVLG